MNTPEKMMAMGCLAVMFCVAYLVQTEMTKEIWGIFGAFCTVAGITAVVSGVRSVGRKIRK